MQVSEPAVRGGIGRLPVDGIRAGWLRHAARSSVGAGRTVVAAGGLGLSLLIILLVPSRAAGASPGHAPRLAALEWALIGCVLVGLLQAVRWLAAGVA